jgi:hypothetical protein
MASSRRPRPPHRSVGFSISKPRTPPHPCF